MDSKKCKFLRKSFQRKILKRMQKRKKFRNCDVLVQISDKVVKRVPFFFIKYISFEKILGIFPLDDSSVYLSATETLALRKDVDMERLPSYRFCNAVYQRRKVVNRTLRQLKLDDLNGFYFARNDELLPQANWIVKLNGNTPDMPADFYAESEDAKVRYVGEFH